MTKICKRICSFPHFVVLNPTPSFSLSTAAVPTYLYDVAYYSKFITSVVLFINSQILPFSVGLLFKDNVITGKGDFTAKIWFIIQLNCMKSNIKDHFRWCLKIQICFRCKVMLDWLCCFYSACLFNFDRNPLCT